MHDRHAGSAFHWLELPDHVHAGGNTANVAVMNREPRAVYSHLRNPPGRIIENAERPPCGHLDQPTVLPPLQHMDPAVVAEKLRPLFDVHRGLKYTLDRGADANAVDGANYTAWGSQVATSRYPGRR
jgi:hypothetical protein